MYWTAILETNCCTNLETACKSKKKKVIGFVAIIMLKMWVVNNAANFQTKIMLKIPDNLKVKKVITRTIKRTVVIKQLKHFKIQFFKFSILKTCKMKICNLIPFS
jgi:hypothetical protein